jgi:hypothetical protein
VLALGTTATVVLVTAAGARIPTVSDVSAAARGSTVEFTWSDPGLRGSDSYAITTNSGTSSFQRSTDFIIDAEPGSRVCVSVAVNRAGKSGAASDEKCVDTAP